MMWAQGGDRATPMMTEIKHLKRGQAGINIAPTQGLVPDEELPNMGDTPVGLITAGNYSSAAERPANAAFLAAWKAEYADKAIPDFLSVGGWDGMTAVYDVIKQTKGKFDGDQ